MYVHIAHISARLCPLQQQPVCGPWQGAGVGWGWQSVGLDCRPRFVLLMQASASLPASMADAC
jgi:hypothetical protein